MSIAEHQPIQPERTVEIYTENRDLSGAFRLSGNERQVDDVVCALLQSPAGAGSYSIEESATPESIGDLPQAASEPRQLPLNLLPGEWVPISEEVLRRIRPPLSKDAIKQVMWGLDKTKIKTCGDVLDGGLVGLSHTNLTPEGRVIVGRLAQAVTGREISILGDQTSPR